MDAVASHHYLERRCCRHGVTLRLAQVGTEGVSEIDSYSWPAY